MTEEVLEIDFISEPCVDDRDWQSIKLDSTTLLLGINDAKILSDDVVLENLIAYKSTKDTVYRDRVFNHCLRLVIFLARKYKTAKVSEDDLIQEGCIGLLRAIELFDVDKGIRISTYAYNWILQYIIRYLQNHGDTIRMPAYLHSKYKRYSFMMANSNDNISDSHLQEELGVSLEDINLFRLREQGIYSLDYDYLGKDSDGSSLVDVFVKEDSTFDDINLKLTLDKFLSCLTDWELELLSSRFGLKDGNALTYAEMGVKYNRSRQAMEQKVSRIIKKLKAIKEELLD